MSDAVVPRVVLSVLVEELVDSVLVTWGLGDVVAQGVGSHRYEVEYYGPGGTAGKKFGVRFAEKTTAYVWDDASTTQANYDGDCVTVSDRSIVVRYRDASLGIHEVGTIQASVTIDSKDEQLGIPVTLLR
jgi:hypothetical protein